VRERVCERERERGRKGGPEEEDEGSMKSTIFSFAELAQDLVAKDRNGVDHV